MASKATPRRPTAKKGKDPKAPKAGKRARSGTANGAREELPASNVTRETIEEYFAKYATQRKSEDKANEALKAEKSKTSTVLKEAKENGCPIDAFREVVAMGKLDESEIRLRQRDVKRVLSIVRPNLAKQLDMFVDSEVEVFDHDADGYRAYKNNEPRSNNPAKVGSQDAQLWDGGWDRAMNENIRTMGPDKSPADATAH